MYRKVAFTIFLVFAVVCLVYALKSNRDVTTTSDEAYTYYQDGLKLEEQLYYRDASVQFEKAVAEDSNFAMALARLSFCYKNLGYRDKGEATWKKAIGFKDRVSERERLFLTMWQSENDHDTTLLRKTAEEYIDKYPTYREGYLMLGGLEMMTSSYERAIEYFTEAVEADPKYANGHNMLGYLNYYQGRYDEALRHLTEYSRLAPNEANPHDSRGEVLHALGRYDEAIEEFRTAFNINPDFAFAIEHMARSYAALGRMSKVDYCFGNLLDHAETPERHNYYLSEYGEMLLLHAELDDSALAIFHGVLQEDPEFVMALRDIGYVYYCERNAAQADIYFDSLNVVLAKKIAEDPKIKDDISLSRSAMVIEALRADLSGDLDTATALLDSVVALTGIPTEKMRVRYYYADMLFRQGNIDQAQSELQKNLSVNPNHVRSLLLLADIYDAQNDPQSALAYRQRAAAIWKDADPDFKPAQELREKISSSMAVAAAE